MALRHQTDVCLACGQPNVDHIGGEPCVNCGNRSVFRFARVHEEPASERAIQSGLDRMLASIRTDEAASACLIGE